MAKKKKNLPELKAKREPVKKSMNPFEVHFNRQKFTVLNRQMKADRGLPGVARAKAIKKRKETLLQEYKVLHKSNKFLDRRIGENNKAMTKEDRIIARFSAERMKSHKRKDIFNLADDEVLTHKGQSIAEIEKFDEPLSDDEGDIKGLDAKFVEEANFGGGMLSEGKSSRASVIEQLIAESKKRKAERQLAKEKTLLKTEELDAEWKELIPIVNMGRKNDEEIEKKDSYDKILSELKFEPRGTPSNKLKSEAELAEEEAKRLRELEEERLKRMRGEEAANPAKPTHRSADDLDDEFEVDDDGNFELTYDQEGNLLDKDKIQVNEEGISDGDSCSDEEDSEDEDDEDDEEKPVGILKRKIAPYSSICPQRNTTGPEEKDEEKSISKDKTSEVKTQHRSSDIVNNDGLEVKKDNTMDVDRDNAVRDKLPYAFEVPECYEELDTLLNDRSVIEQAVIIERMIKCNHPSLQEKNKEKMEHLFALLMQHLNDTDYSDSWSLLSRLAPYLFDLSQFSPANAAYCLSEVILEKHTDFLKKKSKYPTPETLLFLKLVPLLFPTSDKRHPVTTPAFLFIAEILRHCLVTTRRAIASGLFLVSIFTEYICLSKRILPEVLNFLSGVIHLATPTTHLPLVHPFKKEHKFLFLHSSLSDRQDITLSMKGSDLETKPGCKIDDDFRVRSIDCALKLIGIFVKIYEDLPACQLLFELPKKHLDALEINKYPEAVQKTYSSLLEALDRIMKKGLEPIIMEVKKPKPLRLYEPIIKPVYDSKKKNLPPEKAEHMKLLSRYRQEMKGAMREIRRDREFLTKIKFKEISASDAERKRKVREIYANASYQQAELNGLDKFKKKLKRKT